MVRDVLADNPIRDRTDLYGIDMNTAVHPLRISPTIRDYLIVRWLWRRGNTPTLRVALEQACKMSARCQRWTLGEPDLGLVNSLRLEAGDHNNLYAAGVAPGPQPTHTARVRGGQYRTSLCRSQRQTPLGHFGGRGIFVG